MAALEKIRSKSVMLLVVIGVALLAFIIGDFLNSGRSFFGAGTTVATVDGTKISIQEFQKRYEEYNQRLQESNQKVDPALVQNQVMNGIIEEQLLKDQVEALGIVVTSAELTEAMTGKSANYQMIQFAQQMGMETPAQLHDFIFNPGKYNVNAEDVKPVRDQWLKMEEEITKQLEYQKMMVLLTGAIQANDLDKKALAADMSTASTINMANLTYASVDNKDYPVSEEELKARYEKEKNQFKLDGEIRNIHYIAVDIVPSEADLAKAKKTFDGVVAALQNNKGLDAARAIGEASINQSTILLSQAVGDKKAFLETAEVEAVSTPTFNADKHSVFKLLNKKMDVDSVRVAMVQVQGAKATQDSVLKELNSGKKLAEVINNQTIAGQDSTWINLMNIGNDEQSKTAKAKLLAAGADFFVLDSNDNGAIIYKVYDKKAPKQMYEVADVTYTVTASDETIDNLRGNLQEFINKNNTNKTFTEQAIAAGYQAQPWQVSKEDAQISRIEYTRKEIQWAFGASVGSVSPIYEEGNEKMIAVCLDEIVDGGYMPLTDATVKSAIESMVRNDKKGDALVAKYQGKAKDVKGYADLMKVSLDTAVVVSFAQDFIPQARGMESKLNAQAPYSKKGQIYGPIKGDNGVFVYEVVKNEQASSSLTPEQLSQRYDSQFGAGRIARMTFEILKEGKEIENNLMSFY